MKNNSSLEDFEKALQFVREKYERSYQYLKDISKW